ISSPLPLLTALTHNHTEHLLRHIFFFQAEDGIRDGHVTGVQTCALPILTLDLLERALEQFLEEPFVRGQSPVVLAEMTLRSLNRSEERRVGKECRSRWGPLE